MADLSGIGKDMKVESGSTSVACKMTTGVEASSAWCNLTDCPSYGKWWCPFTGW